MKFKKALKKVEEISEVTKLSDRAKVKLLSKYTGIKDGETLCKEIASQGFTLENVALITSVYRDYWPVWTEEDVKKCNDIGVYL